MSGTRTDRPQLGAALELARDGDLLVAGAPLTTHSDAPTSVVV
jgi:hypothetical protein